ncbi:hypothetical protein LZ554_001463 [Drepanopeziza brunnea f. sp. 'monogermtubi']|nr:hypothetical protein LZ554_001463 [Drepanopeziza brunnea f. sp. 'monogermtubi']
MQPKKINIESDGSGTVTLVPEEPEDMWHAYNLIAPSDFLTADAIRRIATESSTGSSKSYRVRITLKIRVTSIDFDPQAGQLHISGRVANENEHVKMGAYHTLDLELQRRFTLEKGDGWDSVAKEVLAEAIKDDKEGVVPAVVMQEGMANICLITEHQTILKQRVETRIPKKRSGGASNHDEALKKFYEATLRALSSHVDITQPRPILLASPGFTAAGFTKYIVDEATRKGEKAVLANKKNFVVIHSSSGHLHSLNEVLKSPEVLAKLKNTKYARETRLMDDFMTMLRRDDGRAWYGPTEVEQAVEKGAVGAGGGVLLINNSLFRSQEIATRKRWVTLVDKVKETGGDARVLSSDHESEDLDDEDDEGLV